MSGDWDGFWMKQAEAYAARSKDPSTKVGCVLVRDRHPVSEGYNGFPVNADDDPALYLDRALKYERIVHAEANAVAYAARYGRPVLGARCYSTFPTCPICAGVLIDAGISAIVVKMPRCEYCDNRMRQIVDGRDTRIGQRYRQVTGEGVSPWLHTIQGAGGPTEVRCGLPASDAWLARYEISKQLFRESGVPVIEV
jgi:dCMP deaminase